MEVTGIVRRSYKRRAMGRARPPASPSNRSIASIRVRASGSRAKHPPVDRVSCAQGLHRTQPLRGATIGAAVFIVEGARRARFEASGAQSPTSARCWAPDLHCGSGMWTDLAQAASLGLSSTPHCVAMCAPLVGAGCVRHGCGSPVRNASSYVAGRTIAYGALGALAGTVGNASMLAPVRPWLRTAAELVVAHALARLGVQIARRMGGRQEEGGQAPLRLRRSRYDREKAPAAVSAAVHRLVARAASLVPRAPFALGASTALFPCGALGGAVILAASTGSPGAAAASMAVFSMASAPVLVVAALAGASFSEALWRAAGDSRGGAHAGASVARQTLRAVAACGLLTTAAVVGWTALAAAVERVFPVFGAG